MPSKGGLISTILMKFAKYSWGRLKSAVFDQYLYYISELAFGALTLFFGRQEGHPA